MSDSSLRKRQQLIISHFIRQCDCLADRGCHVGVQRLWSDRLKPHKCVGGAHHPLPKVPIYSDPTVSSNGSVAGATAPRPLPDRVRQISHLAGGDIQGSYGLVFFLLDSLRALNPHMLASHGGTQTDVSTQHQ